MAVLIAGKQAAAIRRQSEVAGARALHRIPGDRGDTAVAGDGKGRDAVVAAIGDIHEAARRRDHDFRAGVVAGMALRCGRYALERRQFSVHVIPAVSDDGGVELIHHIGAAIGGVKGHVTRCCTVAGPGRERIAGNELSVHGIEAVDMQCIQALVGENHPAASGVEG
jgi:hypothetical protein